MTFRHKAKGWVNEAAGWRRAEQELWDRVSHPPGQAGMALGNWKVRVVENA